MIRVIHRVCGGFHCKRTLKNEFLFSCGVVTVVGADVYKRQDENRGKDREEVVKSELEDYDNGNLTVTEVTSRFGLSVFLSLIHI